MILYDVQYKNTFLILNIKRMLWNFRGLPYSFFFKVKKKVTPFPGLLFADICPL